MRKRLILLSRDGLFPLDREELPFRYTKDFQKLKLRQDKAASRTSKTTTAFFENVKVNKHMAFRHIPEESPDIFPMNF